MDTLSTALRENEAGIIAGWVEALGKIQGEPFGGAAWADPYKETRIAFGALLDLLERNDRKAADEQAARLVRLPPLRGAGISETIRGYYALFEALRPTLDEAYPEGHRETLPHDIERLRTAVGLMSGQLTAAHFAYSMQWQDDWDKMAFSGLKGPVARMISELQALHAGAGETLPHAFREVLRDALRSSRQLMTIVEGLFALHRLGEGLIDAKPEPVKLASILAPVLEDANKRAAVEHKTLVWPEETSGAEVLADKEFMRHAFALLLQRALDETEPGATIRAEMSTEPGTFRIVLRHLSQDPASPPGSPEPVEHAFMRMTLEHIGGRSEVTRDAGGVVTVVLRIPAAHGQAAGGSAAQAAPPSGIRIVRTGPATQAFGPAGSGDSAKAPPRPGGEPPALGEGRPDDSARGNFRIVQGIAPGSLPETKDKPGE